MRFKQPQNGARIGPKPTPRNTRREDTCKKKKSLTSLGNEARKKV